MKIKYNYFVIPVVVFGVLWLGSYITQGNMAWYDTLTLPRITPAKGVFPVVWHALGVLTTFSLLLFYNRSPRGLMFWIIIGLFAANGLLNLAWTKAFFGWHNSGLAFIIAVALEFNLMALVSMIYKRHRLSALLLVPYTLWVLFAVYLNWRVWMLN